MVSQSSSVGYTIMGKTADLTVVQKTTIDTLQDTLFILYWKNVSIVSNCKYYYFKKMVTPECISSYYQHYTNNDKCRHIYIYIYIYI